jgi:hypothetical protein
MTRATAQVCLSVTAPAADEYRVDSGCSARTDPQLTMRARSALPIHELPDGPPSL